MPRSLVLTTDLDARYLDPSERPFTRNLVIVSHESLEPSEFGEARFRDEYQRREIESADCGEADSKSWSELMSEVDGARKGVFAPIHETPLNRAVLIPCS
ncbi:MAG: hypothetical protein JNJ88_09150 [Planctomycetes bacterium]|nr:hypothetical protein [Planctomycetota bacterium]